jgi:SCY1-like protein 1
MWSFFSKDPSKELVNYEILDPVQLETEFQSRTLWSVLNAKKKGSGQQPPNDALASVFSYQMKPGNESWIQPAKNGYKRIKMLRHPNILMYQDGIDSEKSVFVVSERINQLYSHLNESRNNESQKENEISWGLHQIAVNLNKFLIKINKFFYFHFKYTKRER